MIDQYLDYIQHRNFWQWIKKYQDKVYLDSAYLREWQRNVLEPLHGEFIRNQRMEKFMKSDFIFLDPDLIMEFGMDITRFGIIGNETKTKSGNGIQRNLLTILKIDKKKDVYTPILWREQWQKRWDAVKNKELRK